jgi:hypothetical protein
MLSNSHEVISEYNLDHALGIPPDENHATGLDYKTKFSPYFALGCNSIKSYLNKLKKSQHLLGFYL